MEFATAATMISIRFDATAKAEELLPVICLGGAVLVLDSMNDGENFVEFS
jgi:hypothetical protein